ncbi:MAG: hypothetical protein ACLP0J_25525 [Solirubrobacteraceae bacterium]|jgi:hypothetical protein
MRAVDATHPVGAIKRAGKRSVVRTARGGGNGSVAGGLIVLALIIAAVLAALLAVISLPGHLVHLTPSISQIFGTHPPNYVHARYRNVVLGYTITVVGAIAVIITLARWRARPETTPAAFSQLAVAVIALALLALATHTGERSRALTVAQAADVKVGHVQTRALQQVTQQTALTYAQDSTGSDDWVAVPGSCTFTRLSTGFLGTSYDFVCAAQAFNAHRHLTPRLKVAITCSSPTPTASSCGGESDQDVTDLAAIHPAVGPVPAAVISQVGGSDFSLLLGSCFGRLQPVTAPQIAMAVAYDRFYQLYRATPFRLSTGAPLVSMQKLLQEAIRARRECQPELGTILAAALPARLMPTA